MSILETLQAQLAGEQAEQLGKRVGTDPAATRKAIGAALPALMAALAANARRQEGAASLANALEKDHDGSILDDLSGFLRQGDTTDGDGILRHALGAKRPAVEAEVAQHAGLDLATVTRLLPLLAPIVMGALGRQKRQSGLDVDGVAGMLAGERRQARRMAPEGVVGMLGALLDDEGDGLDVGDVADAGSKFLGGLFKKRT